MKVTKKEITVNGLPILLSPAWTDNVPEYSVSELIQEEKLSLQLWGEYYSGNLEKYTQQAGEMTAYNFYTHHDLKFRYFCIEKDSGEIRLFESSCTANGNNNVSMSRYQELRRLSLFALLQGITPFKGLASTSFYFHEENFGYAPFALSNYRFHLTKFTKDAEKQILNRLEIQKILFQFLFDRFPNRFGCIIPADKLEISSDGFPVCFPFTNRIGETVMKVIKTYFIQDQEFAKCYLPLTRWYSTDIHRVFTVTAGLPEKQPLLNLHKISEAEIIVICLSLETAAFHQQYNTLPTIVFTAFMCDDRQYSQVDFSPLKGKSVKILISNDSGETLAECYMKASSLAEYLHENEGIEQIEFIQMAVQYPDMKNVWNPDHLVAAHRNQPPVIVNDSVMLLNEANFAQMVPRAKAEIERKKTQVQDMPFWKEEHSVVQAQPGNNTPPSENLLDKMILRPFIVGGYTTIIESAPGMGKSCFTTALCAQIVGSSVPFLTERCITQCTPPNECGYKVVYLTFDADGNSAIQEHRKDFAGDLGTGGINFIQKDQSGDDTNYSKLENYGKFVSLLTGIRDNEGIPGQSIDVLVIDTLLEFTHGSVGNSNLFFRKLVQEYPKMAVILIHHLNKADETYGGIKSTMAPRAILKLYRTDEQLKAVEGRKPTLTDPFTISVEKFNVNKIPEDGESFALKLDENNHFVVEGKIRSVEEMRRLLIAQYDKRYAADQRTIARLFGTTDRTIRNWMSSDK